MGKFNLVFFFFCHDYPMLPTPPSPLDSRAQ